MVSNPTDFGGAQHELTLSANEPVPEFQVILLCMAIFWLLTARSLRNSIGFRKWTILGSCGDNSVSCADKADFREFVAILAISPEHARVGNGFSFVSDQSEGIGRWSDEQYW